MMKLTLSLLMLIMKFQGNDGKYYTVQKVSTLLSGFVSLFITGAIKKLAVLTRNQAFFLFLLIWGFLFLAHYIWFLNKDKSKLVLHYKEYRRYLLFFLAIMILSVVIYI